MHQVYGHICKSSKKYEIESQKQNIIETIYAKANITLQIVKSKEQITAKETCIKT